MADRPIEVTVENVAGADQWTSRDNEPMTTYEVLFAGEGRTWKVHLPTAEEGPASGAVLRGWKNADKGTFGIAKDRPQNGAGRGSRSASAGGRDVKTEESIQRQTAAKVAGEMAAAVGGNGPVVLSNFEEFFKVVHGLIAGDAVKADAS